VVFLNRENARFNRRESKVDPGEALNPVLMIFEANQKTRGGCRHADKRKPQKPTNTERYDQFS
jgi:hypothetical protein